MGILGYRPCELFLPDPNILSPPIKTRHRLLQIQTQKSRLRRRVCQHRRHNIYSRPHLKRRFFISLVISFGHCPPSSRRGGISRIHRHRMEICSLTNLTSQTLQTSIFVSAGLDLVSGGDILLCQYLLPADLLSSGTQSDRWTTS